MDMDVEHSYCGRFWHLTPDYQERLENRGGYNNFSESENGKDALEKLKSGGYDLILSDWNMKEMGGLELLNAVRADKELRRIPFLMITAEGAKENVLKAIKGGVNGYIIKPFTPEMLLTKIAKILAASKGMKRRGIL